LIFIKNKENLRT